MRLDYSMLTQLNHPQLHAPLQKLMPPLFTKHSKLCLVLIAPTWKHHGNSIPLPQKLQGKQGRVTEIEMLGQVAVLPIMLSLFGWGMLLEKVDQELLALQLPDQSCLMSSHI